MYPSLLLWNTGLRNIMLGDLNRHCFFVEKPTIMNMTHAIAILRAADCTRVGHSHTLSETIRRFYRSTLPAHSVPFCSEPPSKPETAARKKAVLSSPSPPTISLSVYARQHFRWRSLTPACTDLLLGNCPQF